MTDKRDIRGEVPPEEIKNPDLKPPAEEELNLDEVQRLIAQAEEAARVAAAEAERQVEEPKKARRQKQEQEIGTWEQMAEGVEGLETGIDSEDLASVVRCVLDQIEKERQVVLPPELFDRADQIEDIGKAVEQLKAAQKRIEEMGVTSSLESQLQNLESKAQELRQAQEKILAALKERIRQEMKEIVDMRREELEREFETAERNPLFARLDTEVETEEEKVEQAQQEIKEVLMETAVMDRQGDLRRYLEKREQEVAQLEEEFKKAEETEQQRRYGYGERFSWKQFRKFESLSSIIREDDSEERAKREVEFYIRDRKREIEFLKAHLEREVLASRINEKILAALFEEGHSAEEWQTAALEIKNYISEVRRIGQEQRERRIYGWIKQDKEAEDIIMEQIKKLPQNPLARRILQGYLVFGVPQPEGRQLNFEKLGIDLGKLSIISQWSTYNGTMIAYNREGSFWYLGTPKEMVQPDALEQLGLDAKTLETLYNLRVAYAEADLAVQRAKGMKGSKVYIELTGWPPKGWETLHNGAIVRPGGKKVEVERRFDEVVEELVKTEIISDYLHRFFFGEQEEGSLEIRTRGQALYALKTARQYTRELLARIGELTQETARLKAEVEAGKEERRREEKEHKKTRAEYQEEIDQLKSLLRLSREDLDNARRQVENLEKQLKKVEYERNRAESERQRMRDYYSNLLAQIRQILKEGNTIGGRGKAIEQVLSMLEKV